MTLAAALSGDDARALKKAGRAAPDAMRKAIRPQTKALLELSGDYPELCDVVRDVLG